VPEREQLVKHPPGQQGCADHNQPVDDAAEIAFEAPGEEDLLRP
jgi:hypothetical protein